MTIARDRQTGALLRPHLQIALAVRVLRRHRERRIEWRWWGRRHRGGAAAWPPAAASRTSPRGDRADRHRHRPRDRSRHRHALRRRRRAHRRRRPCPPGRHDDDARRVPRRLGALGRARADRAALLRCHHRQHGAARGAVRDRVAGVRPARRRPARHSRRSSSPCRGSSRSISCRRSHWRIAVLENRHALDAIGKARLFLHGRLMHGLKLIVATFVGTLGIVLLGRRGDRAGGAVAGGADPGPARLPRHRHRVCRGVAGDLRAHRDRSERSGPRSGRSAT